ncbi:MAG: hypothetical protein PVJ38_08880 [Candidatus Bathyarchaeota archaeon]
MSEDEDISINYEVIRNQRFMIENARYFIREVDPWKTTKNDLDEETCITVEEFNKWKRHLLKILGVATDE